MRFTLFGTFREYFLADFAPKLFTKAVSPCVFFLQLHVSKRAPSEHEQVITPSAHCVSCDLTVQTCPNNKFSIQGDGPYLSKLVNRSQDPNSALGKQFMVDHVGFMLDILYYYIVLYTYIPILSYTYIVIFIV